MRHIVKSASAAALAAIAALLLFACRQSEPALPQSLHITGEYTGEGLDSLKLRAAAMTATTPEEIVELTTQGHSIEGELPVAPQGFYYIFGQNADRGQLLIPLYVKPQSESYRFKFSLQEGSPFVDSDADNAALSAFNAYYYAHSRTFWSEQKKWDADAMERHLSGYLETADSLAKACKCSAPVKEYLGIWAYLTAANDLNSLSRINPTLAGAMAKRKIQRLESPEKLLNSPTTLNFSQAPHFIYKSLPQGELDERLEQLHKNYSVPRLRDFVGKMVADDYISKFDFNGDVEEGMARLSAAVEKYGLPQELLKEFGRRKASAKGQPFPADIKLSDSEGNAVEFASFHGKYVYVDLWASWCGPCVREVPYLQKLEKELGNPDVVFVSISVDTDTQAWQKKMQELDMHGNQLSNSDNTLATALNVKGIPHFLIYDKEGKLYQYNATRPSQPELKELLQSLH